MLYAKNQIRIKNKKHGLRINYLGNTQPTTFCLRANRRRGLNKRSTGQNQWKEKNHDSRNRPREKTKDRGDVASS